GDLLPGGRVPNLQGVIYARRGEPLAVGAKRQPLHDTGASVKDTELLAARRIPEPDSSVRAGGGKDAPVLGVAGNAVDVVGVALQGTATRVRLAFRGPGIPNADGSVVARRNEPSAVGAERYAADQSGVAAQGEDFLAGRHVPELHGLILTPRHQAP